MSDYISQLEGAVRGAVVTSPTRFSWFGKHSPGLPPAIKRVLTPGTARNYLRYNLQTRLYTDFYCTGSAGPTPMEVRGYSLSGPTPFVQELSEANTGKGYWAGGWEVLSLDDGYVGLHKMGARVWANPEDCSPLEGGVLAPGAAVNVRFPPESLGVSPGYYMAMSDLWLAPEDSQNLVRFYWDLTSEGAARLMREVTGALNKARVPFRFKTISDPERYTRCDAAVLYVRSADYDGVSGVIVRIYAKMSAYLKPDVPALTLSLAPGLGLAEDPGKGQSFGQHRCNLVAEGLIRAYEAGARSPEQKLKSVLDCMAEHGISTDRPYLSPGSGADYSFRVPALRKTGRSSRNGTDLSPLPVSPDSLLDTARRIAAQIAEDAVWYEDRCNWMGADVRFNEKTRQYEMVQASLDASIYTGTSGIALFLAELHSVAPDETLGRTALGAVRHALSKADKAPTGEAHLGLYSGWTGVSLAAARVGHLLGCEELMERARSLALHLSAQKAGEADFDIMAGRAGTIAACPALSDYFGETSLLGYGSRLAEELIESAEKGGPGYSWAGEARLSARNLTGFSHGAGGVGYALLELWNATRDQALLDAANRCFEYERYWFDEAEGNWPDFRIEPGTGTRRRSPQRKRSGENWPFAWAWCNGAPGIALSRLRAFELTGDPLTRAEAIAGLRATGQWVAGGIRSAAVSFSLCHGLAGNAQVMSYGRDLLGEDAGADASSLVQSVAAQGIQLYANGGRPWPCGQARGSTPNLMLGLAGIGHFYLRLYSPATPSILILRREEWAPSHLPSALAYTAPGSV